MNALSRPTVALALCLLLSACSTLSTVEESLFPSRQQEVVLQHDGLERRALVVFPEGHTGRSLLPVVIDLHPSGSDAAAEMRSSGIREAAAEQGYLAVFPEGLSENGVRAWNAGQCCGDAAAQGVDDLGYLALLVETLIADYKADPRRIYVTGFSNGGSMALLLACRSSHMIAGVASVAGEMAFTGCRPVKPMPVMLFHGMDDAYAPYEGGAPSARVPGDERSELQLLSVAETAQFWVERDGCYPVPERVTRQDYVRERYVGSEAGAEVVVYAIPGSGHAWPGGDPEAVFAGETASDLSAAWLMLEFFTRNPGN